MHIQGHPDDGSGGERRYRQLGVAQQEKTLHLRPTVTFVLKLVIEKRKVDQQTNGLFHKDSSFKGQKDPFHRKTSMEA